VNQRVLTAAAADDENPRRTRIRWRQ
jgi:hypothetical protein